MPDRERVIAELSEHFAQGALDVDEFDRRLTLAHTTDQDTQLAALTADLPVLPVPAGRPATTALVPERDVKATASVLAVMGGAQRKGAWTVPRQLKVRALMGGVELDFREARLPPGPIDVTITTMMGGVEIIVPPTLPVEMNGTAIMGGFEELNRSPSQLNSAATVLRVHGFALMGGVAVETRLAGESRRDARKREKRERRQRDR